MVPALRCVHRSCIEPVRGNIVIAVLSSAGAVSLCVTFPSSWCGGLGSSAGEVSSCCCHPKVLISLLSSRAPLLPAPAAAAFAAAAEEDDYDLDEDEPAATALGEVPATAYSCLRDHSSDA